MTAICGYSMGKSETLFSISSTKQRWFSFAVPMLHSYAEAIRLCQCNDVCTVEISGTSFPCAFAVVSFSLLLRLSLYGSNSGKDGALKAC